MHGFNLGLGSLGAHSWIKDVFMRAQRVSTHFRTSTRAKDVLEKEADRCHTKAKPLSGNTTRFTSVITMLESHVRLKPAFISLANQRPPPINNATVQDTLADFDGYWMRIDLLMPILKPFARAIMAIQASTSTLADVTRYWLYIARAIKDQLPQLPRGTHQT